MSSSKETILISTGMGNENETSDAVQTAKDAGVKYLLSLH